MSSSVTILQTWGSLPDGDPQSADGGPAHRVHAAPGPLETDTWHVALRSLPFWQVTGAYFVCGFTTAILTTHFIPYAIDRGFAPATAATALGVMNGLNVIGVLVVGALADRCGQKNLLALVYALRGGAYALFLLAPGAWSLWGFAGSHRVLVLGHRPLTTSLTADVYGLKTLGTLNGVTFLVHQVAAAISIQFAGLMRDLTGSYTIPFTIAGLLLLPAALSAFSIREKQYSARERNRLASTRVGETAAVPQRRSP